MELLELKYAELAKKLITKVCETEHLLVRPYQDSDEDGLFELFHDKNTMRMDGDLPIMEKNEEFVRRINFVKEGPLIWFFSEERENRDFVGYVMLQDEGDAIALGFAITVGKQHHGYGYENYKMGNLSNATKLMEKAVMLGKQSGDATCLACAYRGMGEILVASGNRAQAKKYFQKSIEEFRLAEDYKGIQEVEELFQKGRCNHA